MAASNVLGINSLGEQESDPEGHTIKITERFQFFRGYLPTTYEKYLPFRCQENPTTWLLRLMFRRVTDGSVTCEVTIQRRDNSPVDMRTDFWMRPILPFQFRDLSTRNLRADSMFPNDRGTKTIQFMPSDALVQMGHHPLQLEIFFRICNCHEGIGYFAYRNQERRFRPPADFEVMDMEEHPLP